MKISQKRGNIIKRKLQAMLWGPLYNLHDQPTKQLQPEALENGQKRGEKREAKVGQKKAWNCILTSRLSCRDCPILRQWYCIQIYSMTPVYDIIFLLNPPQN
jgi:hypothetical protein